MKAFCITDPRATEILDVPDPVPARDEVLLQVRMAGFCRSDLQAYRGTNPVVSYPRIPGREIAATILGAGPDVPAPWVAGQDVTLSPYTDCGSCPACRAARPNACQFNEILGMHRDGGMAERLCVPWQKLFRSDALSIRELALVEPLTVGFHAVDRGRVSAADTVAVFGCGATGLGAIAAAAARQARVVAIDIDEGKLAVACEAGAQHTINTAVDGLHEGLQDLTGHGGPDVVIEASGQVETFLAAVDTVAFAGRVVYIGFAPEPVTYETRRFIQKELDIMGSRNATTDDFDTVMALIAEGNFPLNHMVTRVVPFAAAGAALAAWDANPAPVTKILVDMV